ncbi:MAG: Na/Pi cotransporter family protein [Bdellovibrionaceae bacterium]|nr:Na/Pi cotransporter family protein [Pseudobdellovibrionaceae bacterium]
MAAEAANSVSWVQAFIALSGGMALFLFGMEWLSDSLKKVAGDRMRSIMSAITGNRFLGLSVGALVTIMMQSSSATTVMLVTFVEAGILNFRQTLAVILGADVGTTVTAQLIAFKATDIGILMIAIGFTFASFSKKRDWSNTWQAIFGLGLLFFGMKVMIDSMMPLRTYPQFIEILYQLRNPLIGVLFAAAFTALIHSSAAFIGIVILLAQQGLISLPDGIPLILGSNIGTCITAGLASLKASREAKRVALAHVGFKVLGVGLFIFWIPGFASLTEWVSKPFDVDIARQIANAHTIFNVFLAAAFFPFTNVIGAWIEKLLPNEEDLHPGYLPRVQHLNEQLLSTPALALDVARKEVARMTKIVQKMVSASIYPFMSDAEHKDTVYPELSLIDGIHMREKKVDFLEEKVSEYLVHLAQKPLTEGQASEVMGLVSIVSDLESMADIVHRDVLRLIDKKKPLGVDFSPEGRNELERFHLKVVKQLSRLELAIDETDPEKGRNIMNKMEKYLDLDSQLRSLHLKRVVEARPETLKTHEVHMELMDIFKQLNVYAGNIGKVISGWNPDKAI